MPTFKTEEFALAAFMLAGKTLEALQEKQLLTRPEAINAIQSAVNQLQTSDNPLAPGAVAVLDHFYGAKRDKRF